LLRHLRTVMLAGALLAALPAIAQSAVFRHGAPRKFGRSSSSSINWSGYASNSLGSGHYPSVSAYWTQPAVNCLTTPNGYSAFWAGLDGDFTGNTVEQTGTEADCSSGSASYYGWYEMYPKGAFYFGKTVSPGDSMSASVTYGGGWFTLTLTDGTKWTATTRQRLNSAKLASAEAIVEAPSSAGGVLPLADFVTANFTSSSLAPLNPQAITMVSSSGATKANPGAISSGGAFTDTWYSAGP
jgi:peptidase A4-like protein